MRGTLSTLSPWVLTLGGVLWMAKGLGATLAPFASLEPLYAFGFLGGMILFFIALGLAVAGRADAGGGTWIAALLMTLIVTLLLVSVGGSMNSTGRTWYGVEVPIVLSGLIWAVLGVARSALRRSTSVRRDRTSAADREAVTAATSGSNSVRCGEDCRRERGADARERAQRAADCERNPV